jgi:hypothetical protein
MDPQELKSDLLDLQRSQGFQFIESKIKEKRKFLENEMKNIEHEGKTLEQIGTQYVSIAREIKGLDYLFELLESYDIHR